MLVHWPAAWSAAESEAAQAWLKARLHVLATGTQPSRPWALRSVADGGAALLRAAMAHLEALRAELLPYQADIDSASDPYIFMRDVYLQNREFKIYDGEPPEPDYDALLEE